METMYEIEKDINSEEVGGLGTLFKQLCDMKQDNKINDFSVTRFTLEYKAILSRTNLFADRVIKIF